MLAQQARLQLARELGMAPQRVAAVITDNADARGEIVDISSSYVVPELRARTKRCAFG